VTSLGRPLIFYLSNKLTKRDKGFSGDWEGLYSFDLQKRTHLKIADKDSLRFPSPYVEGWITGLVDVSADASVGSEKSGIPHSGNSGTPSDSRKS
jgi:hypothetical protein